MEVGIVGYGRLGRYIGKKLGERYKLIIVDMDAERLSKENPTLYFTNNPEELKDAELIFLALPPNEIEKILKTFEIINIKCPIFNLSTALLTKDISTPLNLIGLKFIGHAVESIRGEEPIFVLDAKGKEADLIKLLSPLGKVIIGKEETVKSVNSFLSEEAIKTAYILREKLKSLGYPSDIIDTALKNVFIGTFRAFIEGDIGPFAMEIIKKLEQ